jgi:mono/diheme cytochrome c family protein
LTYLALADDVADPVTRRVLSNTGIILVPAIAGVLVLLLGLLALIPAGGARRVVSGLGKMVITALLLVSAGLTYAALDDRLPEWFVDKVKSRMTEEEKVTPDKTKRFQSERAKADQMAERAIYLADASEGLPEEGGRYLLRRDPLTQGPDLFKRHCAVCHSHAAVPTNGKTKPTASDLTDFGSKKWLVGFLRAPNGHQYLGRVLNPAKRPKFIKMADWVKLQETQAKKKGKAAVSKLQRQFAHVGAWLASHPRGRKWDDKPEELRKGFQAFQDLNCASCHRYEPKKEKEEYEAPDLTGYGSQEWIRMMIMAPGHPRRYGDNNEMPAFRDLTGPKGEFIKEEYAAATGQLKDMESIKFAQLTDIERELIIRWLVKDYRVVFGGKPITAPNR